MVRHLPLSSLLALLILGVSLFCPSPTWSTTSNAAPELCKDYLENPIYKINNAFLQKTKPTLNPEPGSIEANNPGLIAKLIKNREGILKIEKTFVPTWESNLYEVPNFLQIPPTLRQLKQDLTNLLAEYESEPRLRYIARPIYEKIDMLVSTFDNNKSPQSAAVKANLTHISSRMWETIVACLFDAEEIYIGKFMSQFLEAEFKSFNFKRQQLERIDREIDIAIKNKDGSWRWIEVKDWGEQSVQQSQNRRKLISQSKLQSDARVHFPHLKIQLELALKYGLTIKDAEYFIAQTSYDRMFSILPYGWEVVIP